MKNAICTKTSMLWRHTITVMLIVVMFVLTGCATGEKLPESGSNNSSANNGSSNSSVDNDVQEVDRLAGDVSYDFGVKTEVKRDDEGEIIPDPDVAFKTNPLKGYYETEADALREKILNTGNTEEYYEITGTKYYVSPGGNDENSGTSPSEALRTTEGLINIQLKKGDAVLFERDSVFRATASILTARGVIYGSYGEGDKPKIYASAKNFAEVDWQPSQRKNIWKISYVYDSVGCVIFNHGEEIGVLKTSLRNLVNNGDFYHDEGNNFVYLYSDKGDPSTLYDSIELSAAISVFHIPSGSGEVVIDNLCIKYSSNIAINAYYNCYDVTVTNCEMGFIGGKRWNSSRLGNAIQCWQGARGFVVKNNWIYQTFDTAVSWQGKGGKEYSDVHFVGNLLEYNHTDFEVWDHAAKGSGHAIVSNFIISDNISRFNTLGWGARSNDAGLRGFEGFIYAATGEGISEFDEAIIKDKVIVKNNIIDSPGGMVVNWLIDPTEWDSKYAVSGNKIYINSKLRYSNIITSRLKKSLTDNVRSTATNLQELIAVMKEFDSTITAIWE